VSRIRWVTIAASLFAAGNLAFYMFDVLSYQDAVITGLTALVFAMISMREP